VAKRILGVEATLALFKSPEDVYGDRCLKIYKYLKDLFVCKIQTKLATS
jgi:hypothetical protein